MTAIGCAYLRPVQPGVEGGFFIKLLDPPETLTGADTEADIPRVARDALVAALSFYVNGGRPLPTPSPEQPAAPMPVLVALKLASHEAMLVQGVTNAALAQRVGNDEKAVWRMPDLFQEFKVDNLEFALRLLERRAESSLLEDAA